jgi:hypothetical protein
MDHQGAGLTGMGGIGAYLDLACRSGMVRSLERHVKARKGKQGWTDAQQVLSLVMLNLVGWEWVYRYCPVRQAELVSEIEYIDLKECSLDLGDGIGITTKYLNHPLLCLGNRFKYRGKVFCTSFNIDPFQNVFCADPDNPSYDEAMSLGAEQAVREENHRVEEFF